jgi:phosphoribosylglycinamide formyltransferase 1
VLRLLVLVSGGGSNLASLIATTREPGFPAEVVAVGADRDAPGLAHASEAGIPTFVVPYAEHATRDAWGDALVDAIAPYAPDLVVLSGLMRLLPPGAVDALGPRIVNTHPAYLPEFPGAHAVRDALAAGATETGASVIVVDHGVDTGPVLARRRVPVHPDDTEQTLHDRIKTVERVLLAETVAAIADGRLDPAHPAAPPAPAPAATRTPADPAAHPEPEEPTRA